MKRVFFSLGLAISCLLALRGLALPFSLDSQANKLNLKLADKIENSEKQEKLIQAEKQEREANQRLKTLGIRLKAALEAENERDLLKIDEELLALPSSAKIAALRGVIAFYRRDYPKASLFMEAALLDPRLSAKSSLRLLLGQAELLAGKSFLAWRNFDKALRLGSENWFAFYLRGLASIELGDTEAAKKDLQRSLDLNPKHRATYLNLAWLEFNDGDYAQTREVLLAPYRRNGEDLEVLALLAQAEDSLGNAARGKELLEEYQKLSPDPAVEAQLASHAFGQGNYQDALMGYDRAIGLQADNPILYLNRAMIYLNQGDEGKARADLTRALDLKLRFSRVELELETRELLRRLDGAGL